MNEENNLDYYADGLRSRMNEATPIQVRTIVEDLIAYGLTIPSTTSREKRARPGAQSETFKIRIEGIQSEVQADFYNLIFEFLAYIVWHEWQSDMQVAT